MKRGENKWYALHHNRPDKEKNERKLVIWMIKINKNGTRSYQRIYRKEDSFRKFIYKGKVFFKIFPPILVNFQNLPRTAVRARG